MKMNVLGRFTSVPGDWLQRKVHDQYIYIYIPCHGRPDVTAPVDWA